MYQFKEPPVFNKEKFEKFKGKKIKLIKRFTYCDLDSTDPIYSSLLNEASKDGFRLMHLLPNDYCVQDICDDRIKIYIDANGVIEKIFVG